MRMHDSHLLSGVKHAHIHTQGFGIWDWCGRRPLLPCGGTQRRSGHAMCHAQCQRHACAPPRWAVW